MTEIVWNGAEQMREWLVPVRNLERFPGNPRRGKVAEIAKSLARWGQTRPILTDGHRIVAGNHTYLAALENGWTHIAAVPNSFASEDEARAFLLADNRLAELGGYDQPELIALLGEVEVSGRWDGTGYTIDDLEDLRASYSTPTMDPAPFEGGYAVDPEELARRAEHLASGRAVKEHVLTLVGDQEQQFESDLRVLRKEWGADAGGVSELVARAVAAQAAGIPA